MAIGSSQWMYNSGSDYEIEQSLRFNESDITYLSRTFPSAGNLRTWTFSCWLKRGVIGQNTFIFSSSVSGNAVYIDTADILTIEWYDGSANYYKQATARLRDSSAWYHVVAVYNTTSGTADDRLQLWLNGERVTSFAGSSNPTQNLDSKINTAIEHNIGQMASGQAHDSGYDGYITEVNFIDGQALSANSFGETGDYGEWKPKRCDDARGTNGFYLPFKQDYAVEGFSTVTWKGNGASSAYIGGTGFSPDLLWIKRRDATGSHCLLDTVRGNSNGLHPDTTSVQWTDTGVQKEFNTDGFTVGNHQYSNNNGGSFVAWNWDMGNSYGLPHTITASGATNHSTAQQKFGTSSILFDGTTDKLTAASHADFNLLEKDFTFDMWVNFDVISNFQIVDIKGYADGLSFRMQEPGGSGKIGCYIANNNHTWNWVPSTGTWYHLALVRYGDSLKCYVDGSALTATAGGNVGGQSIAQGALQIGQELTGGTAIDFDGYIDDWRFSNIARYTGNFTVP